MILRTLLIGALIAGTLTGVLFTTIQQLQVTPLILEAETYESANSGHTHASLQSDHTHESNTSISPFNNQRLWFSLLANVLAGIGFALIIASAIQFSGQKGWQKGLLWGIAGFIVFFAAPSFGLHPKLPGTTGAPLLEQQLWWIATATATAVGIALLVFSRSTGLKGIALLLLIMPHIIGAPLAEQAYSSVPDWLLQKFVIASTIANALFWLILGTSVGYLLRNSSNSTTE